MPTLPKGATHQLRVEDTTGKVSTAEVVIEVDENSIPVCQLTTPDDGAGFAIGDAIMFTGFATDVDIANTDLTVELSSDLDGTLQSLNPDEGAFSFETSGQAADTYDLNRIG